MIVADTNLIAYLLIPGDQTGAVQRFYSKEPEWVAPVLWRSELLNIVCTYVRLGRMQLDLANQFIRLAERLMKERSYAVEADHVLDVANRFGLSSYDSEFVALAEDMNVPLITYDEKILRQCPGIARKPR